jgi:hypothetical protein
MVEKTRPMAHLTVSILTRKENIKAESPGEGSGY